jgi:hypothetical protein
MKNKDEKICNVVNNVVSLMEKSELLPGQYKQRELDLFFQFDNEKRPLYKAVSYKKWKDFILEHSIDN